MSWTQGPLSDKDLILWGIQVFWCKRFLTVIQMLLGFSILFDLATKDHKAAWHKTWLEKKEKNAELTVAKVVRFRTLFVWGFLAAATLSLLVVSGIYTYYRVLPDRAFFPAWGIFTIFSSIVVVPACEVVLFLSFARSAFTKARKYYPFVLEWFFRSERIDFNYRIVLICLLVVVTAAQLCLN